MRKLFCVVFFLAALPYSALAAERVKLPYAAGERFVVTTGYNTPPTHIKKDSYAIDLSQNGCDAYDKPAVAAFSGTAWIVQESGYNGGYGTQLLILSNGKVVSRYAHLIPGSIPVDQGDEVPQGTIIGEIGDTGLVAGTACAEHPGTHIHFAMDTENADGSFAAKDPEPISDYTGITAGAWYVSDNALAATTANLASLFEIVNDLLGSGVTIVSPTNTPPTISPPPSQPTSSSASASAPALTVPSSSFFAESLPQISSTQNASSTSIPFLKATSSAGNVSSGGGAGPVGGVSVSATAPSVVSDDPSDDSVPACE